MKKLAIYRNDEYVGTLTEENNREYTFSYDNHYYIDKNKPAISLTLPKSEQKYHSAHLFPFFFNMLSEGVNRDLQSRLLRIDKQDYFSLLSATAQTDTIGAITVKPIK